MERSDNRHPEHVRKPVKTFRSAEESILGVHGIVKIDYSKIKGEKVKVLQNQRANLTQSGTVDDGRKKLAADDEYQL